MTESVQQLPEGIDGLRKYTIQPRLAPSLPLDSSEMGLFSNGVFTLGTRHGKAGGIKRAG